MLAPGLVFKCFLHVRFDFSTEERAGTCETQVQRALNEVEDRLSASRRAFNASVMDYNNAVEMFPTNVMANMMGLRRRVMFEIPETERQNVNVGQAFSA